MRSDSPWLSSNGLQKRLGRFPQPFLRPSTADGSSPQSAGRSRWPPPARATATGRRSTSVRSPVRSAARPGPATASLKFRPPRRCRPVAPKTVPPHKGRERVPRGSRGAERRRSIAPSHWMTGGKEMGTLMGGQGFPPAACAGSHLKPTVSTATRSAVGGGAGVPRGRAGGTLPGCGSAAGCSTCAGGR